MRNNVLDQNNRVGHRIEFKTAKYILYKIISLLIILGTCYCDAHSGEESSPARDATLDKVSILNCGFNAVVAALSTFDNPIDSHAIMSQLRLDERLARSVSFLDMRRVFETHGLKADAVANAKLRKLSDISSDSKWVAIIHELRGDATHFFVVACVGNKYVLLDYPYKMASDDGGIIEERMSSKVLSGNILLILQMESKDDALSMVEEMADASSGKDNSIDDDEGYVDLDTPADLMSGGIRYNPVVLLRLFEGVVGQYAGSVRLTNESDRTVRIGKIEGSCSCFLGVVESKNGSLGSIPPGKYVELMFAFDKMRYSTGSKVVIQLIGEDSDYIVLETALEDPENVARSCVVPDSSLVHLGMVDDNKIECVVGVTFDDEACRNFGLDVSDVQLVPGERILCVESKKFERNSYLPGLSSERVEWELSLDISSVENNTLFEDEVTIVIGRNGNDTPLRQGIRIVGFRR